MLLSFAILDFHDWYRASTATVLCRTEVTAAQLQGKLQRMATLESKLQELKKENDVLAELNGSLIANQCVWKNKLAAAEQACTEKDSTIQVCELVFQRTADASVNLCGRHIPFG
jgi:hypothetical protein